MTIQCDSPYTLEYDAAAVAEERRRKVAAQLASFESLGSPAAAAAAAAAAPPPRPQVLAALHPTQCSVKLGCSLDKAAAFTDWQFPMQTWTIRRLALDYATGVCRNHGGASARRHTCRFS